MEAAYEESRDDLYLYLRCFRIPGSLAQELTQETFLRLFQTLRRGESIDNVRGWLFRVARNLALKSIAKERLFLTVEFEAEHAAGSTESPESALLERERMARVAAAVSGLSPQQKECLHLRWQGLKYREIADAIGISSSAVGEFLRRGLNRLREAVHG